MNEPVYVAPRRKRIPQIEQANRFFFFISLLYYFGMLTISGTHQGRTRLTSVTN